jgi:molybdenum cofactor synthesis domain-containing protein
MTDAFCGDGVAWQGEPNEGKLNMRAERDGLFKVEVSSLAEINMLGEVMCASRHTNTLVKKGDVVAGTRAIPLAVSQKIVRQAVDIALANGHIFHVKPLRRARAGVIITGNEVFTRIIEDQFEPVLSEKIEHIGSQVLDVVFAPDDPEVIAAEIQKMIAAGADLILTTGGMSVDPDDVTRIGVQKAGGSSEFYGTPVLPGAMFMLADIDGVPVLGIPACGLYHKTTMLDLVLPRILAGETLTRKEIAGMGHGGLCLNCPECRFPVCPFGK